MTEVREKPDILIVERALAEAAKMICTLKCGRCPLREESFRGCPRECTEDVRPWQCWVAHFIEQAKGF